MSVIAETIYERLFAAIVEQALPPGTKLGEESLAEVFGVGRTRIRGVLSRLASDHMVRLVPNRGAFVARPTVVEAQEVFATRQLLEREVVARLAGGLTRGQTEQLRRHVAREREAHARGHRRTAIRLSGAFHVLLAELADNRVIAAFLKELVSRTSLIIAVYEAPGASCCPFEEHDRLIDLIARKRPAETIRAMLAHLEGIEARLNLERPIARVVDLREVLASGSGERPEPARHGAALEPATLAGGGPRGVAGHESSP